MTYSDYIVYVDESGDHGVKNIDPHYPIFVLSFCVFKKDHYCNYVLPKISAFKMKYWGNTDTVILHEAELRRPRKKQDEFLSNKNTREQFFNELAEIMQDMEFFHITTIINKDRLKGHRTEQSIYETALLFCMERLHKQLSKTEQGKIVDITIESRGREEDIELELEFRRILDGAQNTFYSETVFDSINYRFHMTTKDMNIAGLQVVDLICRPIGMHTLKPNQINRSYEIIKGKNDRFAPKKKLQMIKPPPT